MRDIMGGNAVRYMIPTLNVKWVDPPRRNGKLAEFVMPRQLMDSKGRSLARGRPAEQFFKHSLPKFSITGWAPGLLSHS